MLGIYNLYTKLEHIRRRLLCATWALYLAYIAEDHYGGNSVAMADVRSLLRQERAQRQQSGHPQRVSAVPSVAPTAKKRKAADDTTDERKRTRTASAHIVPSGFFDAGDTDTHSPTIAPSAPPATLDEDTSPPAEPGASAPTEPPPASLSQADEVDNADLDAFMKEIEEMPVATAQPDKFTSTGLVAEAAPMTAAEIAAQAREEQSAQRGKREEELEADKEEAAQQLQDEFDEMETLEERVRRLREQREALREVTLQAEKADVVIADAKPAGYESDGSESVDEDDEWDDWRFRPA